MLMYVFSFFFPLWIIWPLGNYLTGQFRAKGGEFRNVPQDSKPFLFVVVVVFLVCTPDAGMKKSDF